MHTVLNNKTDDCLTLNQFSFKQRKEDKLVFSGENEKGSERFYSTIPYNNFFKF